MMAWFKKCYHKWQEQREIARLMDDLPYKVYRVCTYHRVEHFPGKQLSMGELRLSYHPTDYRMRCVVYWHETCVYKVILNPCTIEDRMNINVSECHPDLRWLRWINNLYQGILNAELEDYKKRFAPLEAYET